MNKHPISLLKLKIDNFRSFGKEQEISFSDNGHDTRKITAIVGLNATGKSNILRSLLILQDMVKNSANAGFVLPYDPFRFVQGFDDRPTKLELQFRHNSSIFSYSISYNSLFIASESLKEKPLDKYRQRIIFERTGSSLNAGAINFGFNHSLMARTRHNTLLITKAIEDNNKYAVAIHDAINSFQILSCGNGLLERVAVSLLRKKPELIEETVKALNSADFSIKDIRLENVSIPIELLDRINISEDAKRMFRTKTSVMMNSGHILKDDFCNPVTNNGSPVYIGLDFDEESIGTRAFLGVIVPILDSIKSNKTLFIDEFGAYMHFSLVKRIIESYKSKQDTSGLIVCTHAGMMLNCIERDSIFITEKNHESEESIIHKMSETGARLGESYSNGYYSDDRYSFLRHKNDNLF